MTLWFGGQIERDPLIWQLILHLGPGDPSMPRCSAHRLAVATCEFFAQLLAVRVHAM